MGTVRSLRVVLAAFACAVVLLTPEGAFARPRKKAPQPAADTAAPTITHEPITTHSGGPPVFVKATIVDESGVFEPTLVIRKPGGAYMRVPMAKVEGEADAFSAEVPSELLDADLEYLIEAFDTNGNGPARAGAEEAPLVVVRSAPLPPPPPVAPANVAPVVEEEEGSAAPILIGAGVATGIVLLVGGGLAIAYVLYTSREPDPTRTRVTVEAPAPVAALTGAAR